MAQRRIRRPNAVEIVEPIEPESEDFSDVMGDTGNEFKIENPDPTRQYCWAHDTVEDIRSKQADVVGWKVVSYEGDDMEGAVRARGGIGILQPGERITVRDHVLMDCDKDKWLKRQRWNLMQGRQVWQGKKREATQDTSIGQLAGSWQAMGGATSTVPKEAR